MYAIIVLPLAARMHRACQPGSIAAANFRDRDGVCSSVTGRHLTREEHREAKSSEAADFAPRGAFDPNMGGAKALLP
jgi:hypothetical protein